MNIGPRYGLFVDGVVRDTKCRFLIDTGSTDTLISSTVYYQMPTEQRPVLETDDVKVRQIDGSPLPVMGIAWVEVQVGRTTHLLKATFIEMNYSALLGMDFLVHTGGKLDFQLKELRLNGERIKCTTSAGEPFVGRVVVLETTVIPPGHEALVPGIIARRSEQLAGPAIIEPVEGGGDLAQKGLVLARSLVDTEAEVMPLRIFNPGKEIKVARKGITVGVISQVESDSVQDNSCISVDAMPDFPVHLHDLYERGTANIEAKYHSEVRKCLTDFQDVFSKGDHDIGRTNVVKHHIKTCEDARPIKERPRRQPYCHQQEIQRQVDDLKDRGVIEPSDSPWAANVVLVNKKDGTKRFCVDYRKLNAVTIKDAYPVPRIDETFDALKGAKWFTTLDLASGYWQVTLDEDASQKSTFVVRNGLFRWKCMPFGLCNAPATFERLMEKVMAGLQWEILLIYLDDVIVFGQTVTETVERLRVVLDRLRNAGLKLKPSKCHLFKRAVTYLGHIVSSEGVATDPNKVQAVAEWPIPKCVKDVRSFLGLASYYRKFIRGFAEIASPLHALTEKSREFVWTESCQRAFDELKGRLLTAPILSYPIPEENFILDTDASGEGIGAVLSQVQDGAERVVAYASRKLSKPERNYCVTRRELLAVVVHLKKFKQYLYGQKVTVRTDHAALRWLLNFKNPEGQLARWMEVISEYDFVIEHRPGKKHANADGLSRQQCKQCGREEAVSNDTTGDMSEGHPQRVEFLVRGVVAQPSLSGDKIRKAQLEDDTMNWVIRSKEEGKIRPEWKTVSHWSAANKSYWSQWDQLEVREGLLYKRWESDDGTSVRMLLVLPNEFRKEILGELHGGQLSGHLGVSKTLAKVKYKYFWPGMSADVRSFLRVCDLCAKRKSPAKKRLAPLQQYRVGVPLERVAIDLLGPLPKTDSGNQWILVVGDYCTKWMEAYALPDATASTVALKLVNEFVCRFGVPQELHSDQGTNFESGVFREMCRILGITKTRTTAYNPKSDGMVERFNKTLVNMVSVMLDPIRRQRDWDEFLPYATFAYRCTPHDSVGESPNMMMLGREVSIPIDLVTKCSEVQDDTCTDFAEKLRSNLQQAHGRARECLGKSAQRQKKNYDRRASEHGLKEGQFAWLFNPAKKRHLSPKLQLRWEGPWLILKRMSDVTFRIQLKRGSKPRVVHVDRLKPYLGEVIEPWDGQSTERSKENPQGDQETAQQLEVQDNDLSSGNLALDANDEVSVIDEAIAERQELDSNDESESVGKTPPGRYPKRVHKLPLRYR